jgi:uncharacterized protein YqjF (DUF2071 family)
MGIAIPFHTTFEEVNLRFYVRYKISGTWKRGVVFLKEIVPKHAITFVANTLYGENYATHPMKHEWNIEKDSLEVSYQWKAGTEWNYLKAHAGKHAVPAPEGSAAAFITEHYWGYTFINHSCTGEYRVAHPKWNIHTVHDYAIKCNAATLYGPSFAEALAQQPRSVFLAEGSAIEVYKGSQIRIAQ